MKNGYMDDREIPGVSVSESEGYHPYMTDFHSHDYYEINFILSGDMSIYLPNIDKKGSFMGLVLSAPGTPHYITCTERILYKRINLFFYEDFIAEGFVEYKSLLSAFSHGGNIIELGQESASELLFMIRKIAEEKSIFRKRALLSYILSFISELDGESQDKSLPPYIDEALAYISENYSEKILSSELAHRIGVGRTTLMTSFKKHLGITLGEYITKCRILNAVNLLKKGKSEGETAELCGFGEPSNLIRSFKKEFGMTPIKYMNYLTKY